MHIRKCIVISVLYYTIVWVNKINPCIGEVFVNGSVTVDEDTAILTLTASVNGTFQCNLDSGSFHTCYSGDIYNNLTAGWHSIEVLFTPDGLSQVILLPSSLGFNILPGDCGNLSAPANGGISLNSTLKGSVATYFCSLGFMLSSDGQRVCQSNSTWSGTAPTCSPIVCKDPSNPANGSSNVLVENNSTLAIGTVIKYTCFPGFKLTGSSERVCQSNGEWNGTMPVCQPVCQSVINCGNPGVPSHGSVTLYDTTVGCEAVYKCDPGYKLIGDATRVCQPNGKWNGTLPTCERVDCGNPEEISNGGVIFAETFFGSLVFYQCNNRYKLVGDAIRVCQSNGKWNGTLPTCERGDCGNPKEISNGVAIFADTFFGSLVYYQCNYGFKLVGNGFLICDMTGAWSGMASSCQPVDCGRPAIPANVFAIYENTTVGSTVTYFCNSSYVLCGSDTCLPNSTWAGLAHNCSRAVVSMGHTAYMVNEDGGFANITVSLDQPSCVTATVIAVPQVQSPRDARRSDFDNTPIMFDISPGDTSAIVSIPITNDIRIERDENFNVILQSNGSDVIASSPKQATVTIIDDDAIRVSFRKSTYAIKDKRVKVCLTKTGKHDFPITVFLHLLHPEGSTISNNSLKFSPKKSSVCYRQSAISGGNITSFNITIVPAKHVRIGTHGSTQIIMKCEVPGKPTNGQHYFRNIQVGRTVTYSCDEGLELVGDQSRECLDTGRWSGSVPVCKSVNCSVEGQLYLGCDGSVTDCDLTCADNPSEFCFGCVPKCRCPSGTVLDQIAKRCVERDECSKNR